ncbi:phosphatidate cytidylyltransferase [Endozoicomonas numazuensis]|uniref:Phosphatidate cytidylyltransferase n=1 Tax=Endozoicomonas numazuensis TaxID=1137799 RepID=A0A081NH86_9GAMM|nr:phosphatidate cytidylyltransferase [Endozoicomonas numazuensis]KEQ17809.1 phosphatidate cytidylyltransferase [Endozoicomonas numazuensis]
MLKQRILTAVVLAPLALASVIFLPPTAFSVLIALVIMLAAWEWANLSGFEDAVTRLGYAVLTGVACWFVQGVSAYLLLAVSIVWWLIAFALVKGYPVSAKFCHSRLLRLVMGLLTLVPAWFALSKLKFHDQQGWTIMLVFLLVWAADVGAYFAGKNLGRHKLAERVSPKKTIEGLVGGLLMSLLVAACVGLYHDLSFARGMGLLLLSVAVVLVSVLGDLFESMLKRERGIKDSSNLLPGHGGVLDRIDSLTAAIPVFTLALIVAGS